MGSNSIKFCGAAGEVTGSKHLLKTGKGNILLDCGLFQGHRREAQGKNKNFLFTPDEVGAAILSHAHIDHCGLFPLLAAKGYEGKIYATPVTAELSGIMLKDSARLQAADAQYYNKIHASEGLSIEPLYTEEDAEKALSLFSKSERGSFFYPLEGIKASFTDSGHVLGSSCTLLEFDGIKLLYTGDLGRQDQLILKNPELPENPDYLIIETTYGDSDHEAVLDAGEKLSKLMKEAVKNRSRILIPGFSLERTQEIIYLIDRLRHRNDVPKIPVYVDSPMSVNVTRIFNNHIDALDFNKEFYAYSRSDGDPFGYDYINYLSTKEESQSLNDKKGPMIIISASGMCEGGRILHHLRHSVEREEDMILIVGYQAEGTLGRQLKEGARQVKIFGMKHDVYCRVINMDFFSAHAGMSDLLSYVKKINPRKGIFLVHGETRQRAFFSDLLKKNGFNSVVSPELGEEFPI